MNKHVIYYSFKILVYELEIWKKYIYTCILNESFVRKIFEYRFLSRNLLASLQKELRMFKIPDQDDTDNT